MEISMKEMFDSGYLINTPERKASWGIFFYFRNDALSRPIQWPLLPACPTHVTMPAEINEDSWTQYHFAGIVGSVYNESVPLTRPCGRREG